MNDIDLIKLLKSFIEENNINAAELARKLETNPANISYWFSDKCKSLSPKNKAKIKAFLGTYYKEHSNAIAINGSAAAINGNATVTNQCSNLLDTLISEIMASDMCSDCKVKAFNILSKHK